jgi:hypothetical protein
MSRVAPTYAEFIAKYTQFSTLTQTVVENQLSFSASFLSLSMWGDWYSSGVELHAAHKLTILGAVDTSSASGGFAVAPGPVTSTSAAGMSTSFKTPAMRNTHPMEMEYLKTVYGVQFLQLQKAVIPSAFIAV